MPVPVYVGQQGRDVGAGDADREVTVVYTAAGQISGGSLKLTIPGGWSNPTEDNVEIDFNGHC